MSNVCFGCGIEIEEGIQICPVCSAEALTGKLDSNAAWLTLDDGQRLELSSPEMLLGRVDPVEDVHPNVDLGVHRGFELGVSRKHALIIREEDHYELEDLGSTNGTFVNREKVEAGRRITLNAGDTVYLGHMKAVFHQTGGEGDSHESDR